MKQTLAIHGGTPVREKFLPYGYQWIDESDIEAVVTALKSDYLTTGPQVQEFENLVKKYVGAKYAVAVSNGTAALHAACYAAGIQKGDEVITTPITFASSSNCILYQGGKPIFADIDPITYNIDPIDIEQKITARTKAIIPVDFTGQPAALDEIMQLAKRYNLTIIEDGAHSIGSKYKEQRIGSIAHMTTFSFHPVKQITAGEGGMIVTDDETLYKRLLLFRTHGITRDNTLLHNKEEGPWYYEQLDLGYNYRITDIQCALGKSQLKRIDGFIDVRREIVAAYNDAFGSVEEVIIPAQEESAYSSWHLYVLQLRLDKLKVGRKEVFDALRAENIGVNVHYIPVYYFPYYQKMGYKKGLCPKAENLYERMITLPLFPKMNREDVDNVIQAVLKVIQAYTV